ncbi:hypothetical protein ASG63_22925 [Methylobacterium sp. Leaf94]|uniref:hypothetical protein n=1 Tax=Methylobacterium sp. Leaf94 TaxID=1736250 RepID=UPI0006FFADE3|nr:hypothetical protein [Methylobacterium sp. Leaf94]KQU21651.1 hypothetical protein ASG63_22925 [Methylobacterium sp. Leaf94]
MTSDRITNRSFASAFAVGGLVVLMIQEAPNWRAIIIALVCLFVFAGLWLLPEQRSAHRTEPRRIHVEIIPGDNPKPARDLLEGHPKELEWLPLGKPTSRWSLRRWRAPG